MDATRSGPREAPGARTTASGNGGPQVQQGRAGGGTTARPDDRPDRAHQRPADLDDRTVTALGRLSEALETVERARGHLYSMHQLIGHADLMLDDVVDLLREAGHDRLAGRIAEELIGRNVIAGRWTFQIVEDFDDGYHATFRDIERQARDQLAQGRRHLYEAEMKERRRSHGRPGHEARPATGG